MTTAPGCRSCGSPALAVFLRLGEMPLPDGLLRPDELDRPEPRFPLDLAFCEACTLVQILEEVPPEKLFVDNYLYFSSYSDDLVRRSKDFAGRMVDELGLGPASRVVEVASNDGYLLRHFAELGVPVLGIDPAPAQADAAEKIGVRTLREFFGADLAARLRSEGLDADLLVANNVAAHTPDLNGFVEGIAILLAEGGVATIENTYVRDLIENKAFDTVYHEHFSYYSCTAIDQLVRRHGLRLKRVEHLPEVQGGSLRWTVGRGAGDEDASVREYLEAEATAGLTRSDYYRDFGREVDDLRGRLLRLLRELRADGRSIAAYGAAAKGTILLNYVGIDGSLVDYVVDRNVHKHGLCMPGVHLPIHDPARLLEDPPDFLLLLAWNYKDEVMAQQAEYRARGGRFIVPVPDPVVV
jgi:SAM-dependent methyltransferase